MSHSRDVDAKPMFQAFRDIGRARWIPIERLRGCVAALVSRLASEPELLEKVQPYAGVGRPRVAALPWWDVPWASAGGQRAHARASYARIGTSAQVRPG